MTIIVYKYGLFVKSYSSNINNLSQVNPDHYTCGDIPALWKKLILITIQRQAVTGLDCPASRNDE